MSEILQTPWYHPVGFFSVMLTRSRTMIFKLMNTTEIDMIYKNLSSTMQDILTQTEFLLKFHVFLAIKKQLWKWITSWHPNPKANWNTQKMLKKIQKEKKINAPVHIWIYEHIKVLENHQQSFTFKKWKPK